LRREWTKTSQILRTGSIDMRDYDSNRSYQSNSGYRIWGGEPRLVQPPSPVKWMSLGLVVGLAIALGTWIAVTR
jgi:hypothetical protein